MKTVKTSDSKDFLKGFEDYDFDIIFADPPYALGSEVVIRKDGKVDYAKANDFMNKWDMPTGEYWEQWFKEAFRTIKHGGWLIMYGMDRQLLLFKYYAALAGFEENQSLYWYYISNFPKATDLSKAIDRTFGTRGEPTGELTGVQGYDNLQKKSKELGFRDYAKGMPFERADKTIYAPGHELAKKYEGYKYSVAPLKQTCETIMVFKKPNKSGSVLHDTLAMENGDDTIACSALNIDGNRVAPYNENDTYDIRHYQSEDCFQNLKPKKTQFQIKPQPVGRYPAQTFIDSQVAEKLDLQSGINCGQQGATTGTEPSTEKKGRTYGDYRGYGKPSQPRNDVGGCSKILHKCDYEKIDFDLFIYEPKVDSGERNNGLDDMEDKVFNRMREDKGEPTGLNKEGRFAPTIAKNDHPTLKPIDLNAKILKLFKTPNEQKICYPFAGSGSEILGGLQAGLQDWVACEINQEYVDIANARIKHYQENEYVQLDLFEVSGD